MVFADLIGGADRLVIQQLGEAVGYSRDGVALPTAVPGVFTAQYFLVDQGGEAGVSSSVPAIFFRLADLPSDPATDLRPTIARGAATYLAREVKKDGEGGVLILLRET